MHLRQLEGVSFVNRGCTKGVHFLSKMVCKRITGGGKVGRPSSYNTLLSAPPSSLRPAARSCVIFAACYCHILSVLLFIVFNWNASIFLAFKSSVHSFAYFFHVKHHVVALDQLKHSCTMGFFPCTRPGEGESVQFREEFVNF